MPAIMTSREFNQRTNVAQKEAEKAPVFITNRGKLAHVLLSYEQYQKLTDKPKTALAALQALSCPDVADIELDMPPRSKAKRHPVDFGEV